MSSPFASIYYSARRCYHRVRLCPWPQGSAAGIHKIGIRCTRAYSAQPQCGQVRYGEGARPPALYEGGYTKAWIKDDDERRSSTSLERGTSRIPRPGYIYICVWTLRAKRPVCVPCALMLRGGHSAMSFHPEMPLLGPSRTTRISISLSTYLHSSVARSSATNSSKSGESDGPNSNHVKKSKGSFSPRSRQ